MCQINAQSVDARRVELVALGDGRVVAEELGHGDSL